MAPRNRPDREDEAVLRLSISKMLRTEGFTVIEAGNGSTAIDLLRDEEAGRIRPDVQVLLTSAYSRDMVGPVAEVRQVKGFIRKPFRLHDLLELLQETLSV